MEMRHGNKRLQPHFAPSYKLFIHNIDYKTSNDEIHSAFSSIGKLRYCDVPVEKNGRLKGYAFVEYIDSRHASQAIDRLNNSHIGIRPIKIEFSNPSKEGATVKTNPGGNRDEFSPQRKRRSSHHSRRSRSYEKSHGSNHSRSRSQGRKRDYRSPVKSPLASPIHSPVRSPIRSPIRSPVRSNVHSPPRGTLSGKIRKYYKSDYYKPAEFHERTPTINEIAGFLSSTLEKAHSTIISMNRGDRNRYYENDDRRRPRATGYGSDNDKRRY